MTILEEIEQLDEATRERVEKLAAASPEAKKTLEQIVAKAKSEKSADDQKQADLASACAAEQSKVGFTPNRIDQLVAIRQKYRRMGLRDG
jgi:hypothetical protein